MAFDLQGVRKQMSTWTRPIVLCFAFGIGVGVAIISTNAIIHYCQSRPKAWDRKSVRATLVVAEPIAEVDSADDLDFVPVGQPDGNRLPPRSGSKSPDSNASATQPLNLTETSSGISFSVDLQNTTNEDVTIPKTVIVMQASRGTHTLHDSLLALKGDYFIPAGHSVLATLENSELCAAHEDPHQCFDAFFKNDDEIVLFDESRKYEIHISIPQIQIPKGQAFRVTEKPAVTTRH